MNQPNCKACPALCCKWGGNPELAVILTKEEAGKYYKFEYKGTFRLKMKLGRCIYLEKDKCSIYEYRPEACREYSCIDFFEKMKRRNRDPLFAVMIMGAVQEILYGSSDDTEDVSGSS